MKVKMISNKVRSDIAEAMANDEWSIEHIDPKGYVIVKGRERIFDKPWFGDGNSFSIWSYNINGAARLRLADELSATAYSTLDQAVRVLERITQWSRRIECCEECGAAHHQLYEHISGGIVCKECLDHWVETGSFYRELELDEFAAGELE